MADGTTLRRPDAGRSEARPPAGRRGFASVARLAALLAVGTLAAGLSAPPLSAQDWREFRAARQVGDHESLRVEVVYGAGRLTLEPADGDLLYDVRMRFDAERFVPVRSWSREDGRGNLRVALASARGSRGRPRSRIRLDDADLDLRLADLKRLGDSAGHLEVGLGRSVPVELAIHVGAAESALELGGIPLRRLELNTGASETRLSFDQPNPARMDELALKLGAATFRGEKLGNADFERFTFEGGVGDVVLDFTGRWRRSARGSIRMGVGTLAVRVPPELGLRIRKKSFLTSFDGPGLVEEGDAYRTPNWGEARVRLELELDAAFGSVRVETTP